MVDFNNEATVGTPAVDINRVTILQRRYDYQEAQEDYRKKRLAGSGVTLCIVRARLFTLFNELQPMFKRTLTTEIYNKLLDTCENATKWADIRDAFYFINEELDRIKLIRLDTQQVYDSTDTEAENEIKGF